MDRPGSAKDSPPDESFSLRFKVLSIAGFFVVLALAYNFALQKHWTGFTEGPRPFMGAVVAIAYWPTVIFLAETWSNRRRRR